MLIPQAAIAMSPQETDSATAPAVFPLVTAIDSIGGKGATGLVFDVDKKGRVNNCRVSQPSGSAELDQGACRILSDKARFNPKRNVNGKAIAQFGLSTRIVWKVTD